jgi:hypothetical protein
MVVIAHAGRNNFAQSRIVMTPSFGSSPLRLPCQSE